MLPDSLYLFYSLLEDKAISRITFQKLKKKKQKKRRLASRHKKPSLSKFRRRGDGQPVAPLILRMPVMPLDPDQPDGVLLQKL